MRRIIASLLLVIGFTGGASAYDSPKALVEAIYQPYASGQKHAALEKFYSARLKDLYAANLERQSVDQKGAAVDPDAPDMLGFDPFIEGQNSLLLDLVIGEPVLNGDRAVAAVSFHNFDHLESDQRRHGARSRRLESRRRSLAGRQPELAAVLAAAI